MSNLGKLRTTLQRIDGRGYKAYKDLLGEYQMGDLRLAIDHVQADPYAPPSRMRVMLPRESLNLPSTPSDIHRVALEDYLARRLRQEIRAVKSGGAGSGNHGAVHIDAGRQQVIERTACRITSGLVELRVSVSLPARGRTILGRAAERLLTDKLPDFAWKASRFCDATEAENFIAAAEDAEALRSQLRDHGLVAFVADGAVLPRESGVSDRPMRDAVVPFESPSTLSVELHRPNGGPITGMGVPEGVTLIVGGGFHGKSTLLDALSKGVYNHIPDDGRETVVTREDAVNIRSEDGRSVAGNDLSAFISRLPLDKRTEEFSSENASGSMSQAANILEAIEAGSRLLLMDEDTCATNFMIRDDVMRKLVPDDCEPITPFIDRVRQLYDDGGVSTILAMGGAGDYFSVADTVIWMNEYRPSDVTERAKSLAPARTPPGDVWLGAVARVPLPESIDPKRGNRTRVRAHGTEEVSFGREQIDLRQVEQIVDPSQTRGVAEILVFALQSGLIDGKVNVMALLDAIEKHLDECGVDSVSSFRGHPGDYARPRRYEVGAALNRLRTLIVRQL